MSSSDSALDTKAQFRQSCGVRVGVGGVACFQLELGIGVGFLKLLESGVGFLKLQESESGVGTFLAITDSNVY